MLFLRGLLIPVGSDRVPLPLKGRRPSFAEVLHVPKPWEASSRSRSGSFALRSSSISFSCFSRIFSWADLEMVTWTLVLDSLWSSSFVRERVSLAWLENAVRVKVDCDEARDVGGASADLALTAGTKGFGARDLGVFSRGPFSQVNRVGGALVPISPSWPGHKGLEREPGLQEEVPVGIRAFGMGGITMPPKDLCIFSSAQCRYCLEICTSWAPAPGLPPGGSRSFSLALLASGVVGMLWMGGIGLGTLRSLCEAVRGMVLLRGTPLGPPTGSRET